MSDREAAELVERVAVGADGDLREQTIDRLIARTTPAHERALLARYVRADACDRAHRGEVAIRTLGLDTPGVTIAHGGSRRGDIVEATPSEYHDLERLRAMETRMLTLIEQSAMVSPHAQLRLDHVRRAFHGADR